MNKKQVIGAAGLAGIAAVSMACEAHAGATGASYSVLPALQSTVSTVSVGTAGTYVTALAANTSRKNCYIINSGGMGTMYIYLGSGTAASTAAFQLAAGSSWACASAAGVITDQIQITTATAGTAGVVAQ